MANESVPINLDRWLYGVARDFHRDLHHKINKGESITDTDAEAWWITRLRMLAGEMHRQENFLPLLCEWLESLDLMNGQAYTSNGRELTVYDEPSA